MVEPAADEEDALARQDRFERATAMEAGAGSAPEEADILERLATAPVVGMGRIPYASNAVFLVELDSPDPREAGEPLRGVYKPDRGERPLWDFPRHTLHLREAASYQVCAALGLRRVPPTVLRDGPHGPGSCQLFVHRVQSPPPATAGRAIESQLRELAALDALINNADRKRAHILVSPPHQIHGIDNALTFLPYPRQRTVLVDLGGSPLPRSVARRVRGLAGDEGRRAGLRERLSILLSPGEVSAFEHRLDELATDPVYPALDPWDGRPFEWY